MKRSAVYYAQCPSSRPPAPDHFSFRQFIVDHVTSLIAMAPKVHFAYCNEQINDLMRSTNANLCIGY
jgi:hypothetical protein